MRNERIELQESCQRTSERHDVTQLAQLQQELNLAVDQLLRGESDDFARVTDAMRRSTAQFRKVVRSSDVLAR